MNAWLHYGRNVGLFLDVKESFFQVEVKVYTSIDKDESSKGIC